MASASFEITTYVVQLGHRGIPFNFIKCYGEQPDHTFMIQFVDDITTAPQNTGLISGDKVSGSIYVPERQYAWYLDLLRNEGPIFAVVDDQNPRYANKIRTGAEPVGEGQ